MTYDNMVDITLKIASGLFIVCGIVYLLTWILWKDIDNKR